MFTHAHHVHYVVRDRDAMVEYLEKSFGMKPDLLVVYEEFDTKDAHYDNIGKTRIQITEPLDPTSAMGKYLATHGPGVWHVAWGVDNIQKVAQELADKGCVGIHKSPSGYLTANMDRTISQGVWVQLAEG